MVRGAVETKRLEAGALLLDSDERACGAGGKVKGISMEYANGVQQFVQRHAELIFPKTQTLLFGFVNIRTH